MVVIGLAVLMGAAVALACGAEDDDDLGGDVKGTGGGTTREETQTIDLAPSVVAPSRWLSPGAVRDLAFTSDGTELASASGGFVKFYDVATGAPAHATPWRYGSTESFAWNAAGDQIAIGVSGETDMGVVVYRSSDMSVLRELATEHWTTSVAFSEDGRWLAAALRDTASVDVWATSDFTLQAELSADYGIASIGFTTDGVSLIGVGDYHYSWSTATWQPNSTSLVNSASNDERPSRLVFTAEGAHATIDAFNTATIASPGGGTEYPFSTPADGLLTVAVPSHDGTMIALADSEGRVLLYDVGPNYPVRRRFEVQTGDVRAVAFSPDNTLLAAGSDDGTLYVWRTNDGQELWHAGASVFPLGLVGASRDASRVVMQSGAGGHAVLSSEDGSLIGKFSLEGFSCSADDVAERLACTSPDGAMFTSLDGTAIPVGIDPDVPNVLLTGLAVALLPNAPLLAQAFHLQPTSPGELESIFRLWNVDDGTFRDLFPADDIVHSLAVSDGGRQIAAGLAAPPLGHVWDVESGDLLARFATERLYHGARGEFVAIAPNGSWVLVADSVGPELFFLDVEDRVERRYTVTNAAGFLHVAASPSSALFAVEVVIALGPTVSEQRSKVLIVDTTSGTPIATLPGGAIGALAFLSDDTVVRGEPDGATSVWSLK